MKPVTCALRAVTLIALIIASASAQRRSRGVPIGSSFPDIKLPALADGKPMSIADFRGKKVLLLTFASW